MGQTGLGMTSLEGGMVRHSIHGQGQAVAWAGAQAWRDYDCLPHLPKDYEDTRLGLQIHGRIRLLNISRI